MAFSFSHRTGLAAVGRNVCPIAFVVLFYFVFLFRLFRAIGFFGALSIGTAVVTAKTNQERAHRLERDNFIGIALHDRGAWHSADHAGVFALRDRHASGGFDGPE